MAALPDDVSNDSTPKRVRIDLRRLPPFLQWIIALVVVAGFVLAARRWGNSQPPPEWASDGFVPVLGWIVIGLASIAALSAISRRLRRRSATKGDSHTSA